MDTPTSEELVKLAVQARGLREQWDQSNDPTNLSFVSGDLYEFAEQSARALDACAEALRWVPVSERVPEVGKQILGFDRFYGIIGIASNTGGTCDDGLPRLVIDNDDDCWVTHWRMLPAPPSQSSK